MKAEIFKKLNFKDLFDIAGYSNFEFVLPKKPQKFEVLTMSSQRLKQIRIEKYLTWWIGMVISIFSGIST